MSDKRPFTFLIRPSERVALRTLARNSERSEGAVLRLLIREAARELVKRTDEQPPRTEVLSNV